MLPILFMGADNPTIYLTLPLMSILPQLSISGHLYYWGDIIYNVIIITPEIGSLDDTLQLMIKIITVQGQVMATLNIIRYNYQSLPVVTKVSWASYFIHGYIQPYNLSNLDP